MKAVRYVLIAIVALIVLAVAAVAIAMAVINPNDYKPQIEQVVEKQTNLDLILEGDIGWSFIPLGLELNNVEATLDGERLVALERLVAQVDFWSLIAMSPRVDTFVLNGLDARLVVNEQGVGNWTRIMPEATGDQQASSGEAAKTGEPAAQPADQSGGAEPLNFRVENVEIGNAEVHYTDKTTGQTVTLEDFTASASDIAPGTPFPLNVAFRLVTTDPVFEVDGSIEAQLGTNEAFSEFSVAGLNAVFDMSGAAFGPKTVTAKLTGSATANLKEETASLSDFTASLANLTLKTSMTVKGFGEQPALDGELAVNEFSLKALMENLGQPAIETRDPEVLKALAFSTNIGGPAGKVELTDLTLKLDATRFSGAGSYTLSNGAVVLNLQGDALNADSYMPPKVEVTAAETVATNESKAPEESSAAPEADLLPLDTLRSLILNVDLGLGQLVVSNLTINDIKASATARDGLLKLDEFSGKLYEGSFGANASLDARSNNPKWAFKSDVSNVQTLPLLTDLAEVEMLAGGANLNMNITTTGNRMSALRSNADGQVNFNLAKGEFRQMNLTRMACQGIALINQESLTATDWGTSTPFNDMRGTFDINGNTLRNTDLIASLAGMRLEGEGTVDLQQNLLDYEAGLRIVGEIHRDNACRVTEYVKNAVIPVECRGNFIEEPGSMCSFDGSRFRDTLQAIAKNAAKAKVQEEVSEAKAKAEEKVKEKLQEELGDKLKGLFK